MRPAFHTLSSFSNQRRRGSGSASTSRSTGSRLGLAPAEQADDQAPEAADETAGQEAKGQRWYRPCVVSWM